MSVKQLPIICLTGPTAVGKSQLAIDLAEQLPCDLISVDSVMVYRGMDIGTAKPHPETLAQTPHHLINIRNPNDPYSAGDFFRDVQVLIQDTLKRQRIPLLVGGTMLYFNTLRQGLANLPNHSEYPTYSSLKAELDQLNSDILYRRLQQYDALTANRLHKHDRQRIQRALTVYYLSKTTLNDLHRSAQNTLNHPIVWMAVNPPERAILRQRIANRFKIMLRHGFLEEAQRLHQVFTLSDDVPAYRAIGYRQAFDYLKTKIDYNTFVTRSVIATCQLAKRQLTWLRSWQDLVYFNSDDPVLLKKAARYITQKISG